MIKSKTKYLCPDCKEKLEFVTIEDISYFQCPYSEKHFSKEEVWRFDDELRRKKE